MSKNNNAEGVDHTPYQQYGGAPVSAYPGCLQQVCAGNGNVSSKRAEFGEISIPAFERVLGVLGLGPEKINKIMYTLMGNLAMAEAAIALGDLGEILFGEGELGPEILGRYGTEFNKLLTTVGTASGLSTLATFFIDLFSHHVKKHYNLTPEQSSMVENVLRMVVSDKALMERIGSNMGKLKDYIKNRFSKETGTPEEAAVEIVSKVTPEKIEQVKKEVENMEKTGTPTDEDNNVFIRYNGVDMRRIAPGIISKEKLESILPENVLAQENFWNKLVVRRGTEILTLGKSIVSDGEQLILSYDEGLKGGSENEKQFKEILEKFKEPITLKKEVESKAPDHFGNMWGQYQKMANEVFSLAAAPKAPRNFNTKKEVIKRMCGKEFLTGRSDIDNTWYDLMSAITCFCTGLCSSGAAATRNATVARSENKILSSREGKGAQYEPVTKYVIAQQQMQAKDASLAAYNYTNDPTINTRMLPTIVSILEKMNGFAMEGGKGDSSPLAIFFSGLRGTMYGYSFGADACAFEGRRNGRYSFYDDTTNTGNFLPRLGPAHVYLWSISVKDYVSALVHGNQVVLGPALGAPNNSDLFKTVVPVPVNDKLLGNEDLLRCWICMHLPHPIFEETHNFSSRYENNSPVPGANLGYSTLDMIRWDKGYSLNIAGDIQILLIRADHVTNDANNNFVFFGTSTAATNVADAAGVPADVMANLDNLYDSDSATYAKLLKDALRVYGSPELLEEAAQILAFLGPMVVSDKYVLTSGGPPRVNKSTGYIQGVAGGVPYIHAPSSTVTVGEQCPVANVAEYVTLVTGAHGLQRSGVHVKAPECGYNELFAALGWLTPKSNKDVSGMAIIDGVGVLELLWKMSELLANIADGRGGLVGLDARSRYLDNQYAHEQRYTFLDFFKPSNASWEPYLQQDSAASESAWGVAHPVHTNERYTWDRFGHYSWAAPDFDRVDDAFSGEFTFGLTLHGLLGTYLTGDVGYASDGILMQPAKLRKLMDYTRAITKDDNPFDWIEGKDDVALVVNGSTQGYARSITVVEKWFYLDGRTVSILEALAGGPPLLGPTGEGRLGFAFGGKCYTHYLDSYKRHIPVFMRTHGVSTVFTGINNAMGKGVDLFASFR